MSSIEAVVQDPERVRAVRGLGVLNAAIHEPLDRVTRLAADAVGAPVSSISLIDAEREYFVSTHGLPVSPPRLRHCPVQRSICQFTVGRGLPLAVSDLREVPEVPPISLGGVELVAYLGVPIRLRDGNVVGALCVVDTEPRAWTEPEVTVLGELADSLAGFFALRGSVVDRVLTDPVSGVPGETLFLARGGAHRSREGAGRSALLCVGLDARRADGRRVGERTRRAVVHESARRLDASLHSTDLLGHLAGDVFGVFAHELDDETDALRCASRLHRALESSPVTVGGREITVSAMIGVALQDDDADSVPELVSRARKAMAAARNCGTTASLTAGVV